MEIGFSVGNFLVQILKWVVQIGTGYGTINGAGKMWNFKHCGARETHLYNTSVTCVFITRLAIWYLIYINVARSWYTQVHCSLLMSIVIILLSIPILISLRIYRVIHRQKIVEINSDFGTFKYNITTTCYVLEIYYQKCI